MSIPHNFENNVQGRNGGSMVYEEQEPIGDWTGNRVEIN